MIEPRTSIKLNQKYMENFENNLNTYEYGQPSSD